MLLCNTLLSLEQDSLAGNMTSHMGNYSNQLTTDPLFLVWVKMGGGGAALGFQAAGSLIEMGLQFPTPSLFTERVQGIGCYLQATAPALLNHVCPPWPRSPGPPKAWPLGGQRRLDVI